MPRGIYNRNPIIHSEPPIAEVPKEVINFPVKVSLFNGSILVIQYPVQNEKELEEAKASAVRRGLQIVIR